MASESSTMDQHRPAAGARTHSGLENLLPASMIQRSRSKSRSRPSLAHLERSISSMTDSFMLEHWGAPARSPPTEGEGGIAPETVNPKDDEDSLTPISNWAHLSYIKSQRNHLRVELKAHQIAGAEAKRSVTSLRRLAFRMAVNISVKEKQLATTARNLTQSRNAGYLEGKDAEKRIESLKRALRIEEGRNKEILKALERASRLTLQYSTPRPQGQHRTQRSLLSPPPSPPTRGLTLSESPLSSPRTPTRPADSQWHDIDWGLTPDINTPADISTSDGRLIRAKRVSDQALATCRSRIEELQAECIKSKDDGSLLEATIENLEQEIQSHQSRIASVERSRAAVEETLASTRSQLSVATDSEIKTKHELNTQVEQVSDLKQRSAGNQQAIDTLRVDKQTLEEQLQNRNVEFGDLEIRTATLEENMHLLQIKLQSAERQESSLRDRLAEKESAREDLRRRLDRGTQYVQLLQQKIAGHDLDVMEHVKNAEADGRTISVLREQLQHSQDRRINTEEALEILRMEMEQLERKLQTENDTRVGLVSELETAQIAKTKVEDELRATRQDLQQEIASKDKLRSNLETLRLAHETVKTDLQVAQGRIRSLEQNDANTQTKLETLRDTRAALESDLREARQELFKLREKLRRGKTDLADVKSSKLYIQHELQLSQERVSSLNQKLEATHKAMAEADGQFAVDVEKSNAQVRHVQQKLQYLEERALSLDTELESAHKFRTETDEQLTMHTEKSNAQIRELESAAAKLQINLEDSQQLKASLREELQQLQTSKLTIEDQLSESLESNSGLQIELSDLQTRLATIQSDREDLRSTVTSLSGRLEASTQTKADLEERLGITLEEGIVLKSAVSELENSLKNSQDSKLKTEETLAITQVHGEASGAKIVDLHSQLNVLQVARDEIEGRLVEVMSSKWDLETQLHSVQSRLVEVESETSALRLSLSTLQQEASRDLQSQEEVDGLLNKSQQAHDALDAEAKSTQAQLQAAEIKVKQLQSISASAAEEVEALHRDRAAGNDRFQEVLKIKASLETELNIAWQGKIDFESQYEVVLGSNTLLERNLQQLRSQIEKTDIDHADVTSKLSAAERQLEELQQNKDDIHAKLQESQTLAADSRKELYTTQLRLDELELQAASLIQKLADMDDELLAVQQGKANVEEQLQDAEQHGETFRSDNTFLHSRLIDLESSKVNLHSELFAINKELEIERMARSTLEERFNTTSQQAAEGKNALRAARMRLGIAESEGLIFQAMAIEAARELTTLREENTKIADSEKDLLSRLAIAEEDLDTVRASNARLEAFLGQVEADMATAEAAVEASEKHLGEFVEESQVQVDAARSAKLKYKRRLSGRNNEIEILTSENSILHHQVGEQKQELGTLQKSTQKLAEDLLGKEQFIEELSASRDKRMKSMNSACNDLRKKYDEREVKDRDCGELRRSKDELASSVATLEQEVEVLKEDKKAFERLVASLQEQVRHLKVLEERQELNEADETSARHITIQDGLQDSLPTTPMTQPSTSSRPGSPRSRFTDTGRLSVYEERPTTRASNVSRGEDFDVRARELDRVRTLRNETASHLRSVKIERHDLKKTLKDIEAKLHQLEKQGRPKRHRTLLRKNRPPTPAHASTEPDYVPMILDTQTRPISSNNVNNSRPFSAGSNTRPNTSAPLSSGLKRQSPLPTRPTTSQRPITSHSMKSKMGERPTTSFGERVERPKDKRRWSHGLKSLFTGEL